MPGCSIPITGLSTWLAIFYIENLHIVKLIDYNSSQFPGAKDAWDKYFKNQKYDFFYESPFGGCFIIK